jgi:ArsR family transcriptional regulator, arsenate/arsenite/antimonite-responsive transcriptional repressor / arsenate reductase (thioredoxin)
MNESDVVKALGALAQDTRLKLFRLLVVAGQAGLTPGQMAEQLAASPTALSFHLKALSHAGLVGCERDGRHLIYRAEFRAMDALIGFLTHACCQGQPCLTVGKPHLQLIEGTQMTSRPYHVLFLCSGNSARSIMAEALLNQIGAGRFRAYSAGSHPAGQVNPHALAMLERNHYRTEGLHCKDWSVFGQADAPVMDFVLTVCDKTAGEVCPVWPGQPLSAHWGVEDPVLATGSDDDIQRAFTSAFMTLKTRVSLLVNLPFDKLDRLSLQQELQAIAGRRA